jgi:AraC-like DNA-binding protein
MHHSYVSHVGDSSATARQVQIGRLLIDVSTSERRLTRNEERTNAVGDPYYVLFIPMIGSMNFSQSGRSGVAVGGEYVLLSQMAFYELSADARSTLIRLRIPAAELRSRLASVDDHLGRRFVSNEHMARLLVDLVRGVIEAFADRLPPNPEALATEIFSFVALAIAAEDRGAVVDVRNARYHLRRRIFDFIEKHLGDQELSPKKIAASSRISLSYLYSLFNDDDTTVAQFVQAKRLQRAYELLVADQRGHRTVSEVAYEVGFKNVSHFSRTFSRHFNMAPRDVRQPARASAETARREGMGVRGGFELHDAV